MGELGCGRDLSAGAVTGGWDNLNFVSPMSWRAVSEEGAGAWRDRLLVLPAFLANETEEGSSEDWLAGMTLTGHFLSRWVFGVRHQPLPAARERLFERIRRLAGKDEVTEDLNIEPAQDPDELR